MNSYALFYVLLFSCTLAQEGKSDSVIGWVRSPDFNLPKFKPCMALDSRGVGPNEVGYEDFSYESVCDLLFDEVSLDLRGDP